MRSPAALAGPRTRRYFALLVAAQALLDSQMPVHFVLASLAAPLRSFSSARRSSGSTVRIMAAGLVALSGVTLPASRWRWLVLLGLG